MNHYSKKNSTFADSFSIFNMTINFITLGCSKNTVDSEVIAAQLQARGHEIVFESTKKTDIVILNTCSFIHDAREESIDEILLHVQRKEKGEIKKVFVVGCLSQRYKKELTEMMPEVDAFYRFDELHQLVEQVEFDLLLSTPRILSTPQHYGYLKLSEGCDRQCSFCAIPLIRGPQVSKPIEKIVEEAKFMANQGVKELLLIAQDLTYYGIDLYNKRELAQVLQKLARIDGFEWIRLHYAYPLGFPTEILDVMAEYPVFCHYLDIPFQHISKNVMHSMRRGGDPYQVYKLIDLIKEKLPRVALRTTLISGYPTETKQDHKELVEFVKKVRFDRLGVFTYSPEEGTAAFELGDPIKQAEKTRRWEEIMRLQENISLENNQAKINSVMKVVIDAEEDNHYIGRTEFDSPEVDNGVYIAKNKPYEIGKFYNLKITDADTFDLFA